MFNLDDIAYCIVSSKVLDTYWELSKYLGKKEGKRKGRKKGKEIRKKEEVERS